MVRNGIADFKGKRILLLQGPVGPFFRRLSFDLTQAGAQVFKVNFNGGDWLFSPRGAYNYRGHPKDWPVYYESLLAELGIEVVLLFGDCRPIHRAAHEIAVRRQIEVGVFEEGYIRPHYITLERFGVNDNSPIPRAPAFYAQHVPASVDTPLLLGNTYWYATLWAICYYLAASAFHPFFFRYRHHRPLTWREGFPWLRSLWRKGYFAYKERGITDRLTGHLAGRYFLVPLQVHNDAQIQMHSDFDSVADFIDVVVESFAAHAPKERILVIKHHPMDRGYFDYTRHIRRLVEHFGLEGRCFYIHDQHLPTLLDRACGVVVVNSTVGLSALIHGTPVKTCGKALYDMQGLTFQGPLNQFWESAQEAKPDSELLRSFTDYLVRHSQLNGSYYKRLPGVPTAAGLRWTVEAPL